MACTSITSGRNESCKDNVGGIKNIYIGSWDSSIWEELGLRVDSYGDMIEDGNLSSPISIYKFELKSDANTFEETNEVSNENQTSFWTQTLTVSLKKQTQLSQTQIEIMSKGQVFVIIEDYNGSYRVAGLYRGLDVQANTSTGGAMGDMNGYTLTMTGVSPLPAHYIDTTEGEIENIIQEGAGATTFKLETSVVSDN